MSATAHANKGLTRPQCITTMTVKAVDNITTTSQPDQPHLNALAIVAHDLRGPLGNLASLLELVESHNQKHDSKQVTRCAHKAGDIITRLDGLLTSMLERVKSNGDPLGARPALIDLNQILSVAVSLNLPAAQDRMVGIPFHSPMPLMFWGDGQLLLQAVENLINNAVKHSSAGCAVICDAQKLDQQVVITVTNHSQMADKLNIQRAFRPFTNLSNKDQESQPANGLGLWIVRLIVERHGGRIEVNSTDDERRTSISLILPDKNLLP